MCLALLLGTFWRRLKDVFERCFQDSLKISWKMKNCNAEGLFKKSPIYLGKQEMFAQNFVKNDFCFFVVLLCCLAVVAAIYWFLVKPECWLVLKHVYRMITGMFTVTERFCKFLPSRIKHCFCFFLYLLVFSVLIFVYMYISSIYIQGATTVLHLRTK